VNQQPVIEGKYRVLFPLGEGRYSKYNIYHTARVKMAMHIATGEKVAIKIFKAKYPFSSNNKVI
jgi:hypothetical protein